MLAKLGLEVVMNEKIKQNSSFITNARKTSLYVVPRQQNNHYKSKKEHSLSNPSPFSRNTTAKQNVAQCPFSPGMYSCVC